MRVHLPHTISLTSISEVVILPKWKCGGRKLETRSPRRGPVVFSEDPANDSVCLANLALLRPYETAALLPAHGEPDTSPGAVGQAIDTACVPILRRKSER